MKNNKPCYCDVQIKIKEGRQDPQFKEKSTSFLKYIIYR